MPQTERAQALMHLCAGSADYRLPRNFRQLRPDFETKGLCVSEHYPGCGSGLVNISYVEEEAGEDRVSDETGDEPESDKPTPEAADSAEADPETMRAVEAMRAAPFVRVMQELNRVKDEPNLAIIIAQARKSGPSSRSC